MHSLYMCKVRLSMHTQHNQINSCSILCSPTKGLDESLKITHLPTMLNLIDKKSGSWESMSVLGNHYIIVSSLGSWGGIITYLFIQANFHPFFLFFCAKSSIPHFPMMNLCKSTIGTSKFLCLDRSKLMCCYSTLSSHKITRSGKQGLVWIIHVV